MVEIEISANNFKQIAALPNEFKTKKISNSNYTILDDDGYEMFLMETLVSNITLTLPLAANNFGRIISIIKTDSNQNKLIIDGKNSEKIVNGGLELETIDICGYGNSVSLLCDGLKWWVFKLYNDTITKSTSYLSASVRGGGGWFLYSSAKYATESLIIPCIGIFPVFLPNKATITKFTVWINSQDTHNFTAKLYRIGTKALERSLMATVSHTTVTSGYEEVSTTDISNNIVDNMSYAYSIELKELDTNRNYNVYALPFFTTFTMREPKLEA